MAAGISVMEVDGLRCTVVRKAIAHVYLRLGREGELRLTAPRRVTEEELRRFVRSRRPWIEKNLARQGPPYAPDYVTGEGVWVWGRLYPLRVEEGKAAVFLTAEALVLQVPSDSTAAHRAKLLESWYCQQLLEVLPAVVAQQEAVTGLHASKWQLREMKSRWGSCTVSTGAIRLNTQLARREAECLRYVVTHELAHLRERGHGPRFYALLEQWYPAWRDVRRSLGQEMRIQPPGFLEDKTGKC